MYDRQRFENMKHNQNIRRQRTRGNGRRYPNQKGGSFDSTGPEAKVRGTAQQVLEKYQALARDAYSAGDRILAEGYLQHAEHYYRIINAENDGAGRDGNRGRQPQGQNDDYDGDDDNDYGDDQPSSGGNVAQPQPHPHHNAPQNNAQQNNGQQNNAPRRGAGRPRKNAGNEPAAASTEQPVETQVAAPQPAPEQAAASAEPVAEAPRKPRVRRPRRPVEQPVPVSSEPPPAGD